MHPWVRLWQNLNQGAARLPPELIKSGPRIQASAQFGGMGERELQLRMEQTIDRILSSRHSVLQPAHELTAFSHIEQQRFLQSGQMLSLSNAALAYQFYHFAIPSLRVVDGPHWDDWITHLLACYDHGGVNDAIQAMQQVDQWLALRQGDPQSVHLPDVERLIESLLRAFGGRPLKVAIGAEPYTDTDTVFLPERLTAFSRREENFDLLKAMAAHLWAQTRFGTYRPGHAAFAGYPDPRRARRYFHALETLRLEARISYEMPGIGRIMRRHNPPQAWAQLSECWHQAGAELAQAEARVEDSLRWLEVLYAQPVTLPAVAYQGTLHPELAESVTAARLEDEQQRLTEALAGLRQELSPLQADQDQAEPFTVQADENRVGDEFAFSLELGGDVVTPPPDVQQLLESIIQDLGEIPDDYLTPAGAGAYAPEQVESEVPVTTTGPPSYIYPEWDHSRLRYRENWCQLFERPITGYSEQFALDTSKKYRRLLNGLRHTFEALREEDRRVRREPDGDEVDLDSFVEAYSDYRVGAEMTERLFTHLKKIDRDITVMFLIDMSGSTAGWVNDLVRETLVLLCHALEVLGDRYAIYGFSGRTHRNCELYPIKTLDEPYGSEVRQRISGITPRDYTRMGVMIRHLTRLLKETESRTRLLITVSDGKPDDQDGYRGTYGIEDTRQALNEARYLGIHPYCITIDRQAMEYLPHMYGTANFAVVSHIDQLPYKVSDIYRRITV